MAFEVSKTGYQQIDPSFGPGYPYPNKYHNVGQLQTPYQGKRFGQGGDYGPPQRTRYYTPQNPNYPYVLDKDFRAEEYLPTEGRCFDQPGYFPCYESKYPQSFTPPDYFSPRVNYPTGHVLPVDQYGARMHSGMLMAFAPQDHPIVPPSDPDVPVRENYGSAQNDGVFDRRRLRVAHKSLVGSKDFYPFDHGKRY